MPNGGWHPGVPLNWQNKPYSYRFSWTDGYYVWRNETPPSPCGSDDSIDAVYHKSNYWNDYFLTELRVSIKERRLLPKKVFKSVSHHKIVSKVAEFLGVDFDIFSDDILDTSRVPGT